MVPPSPNFRTTPAGGRLTTSDLTYTRPTNTADLQWNVISNPPAPKMRPYH
ncbi:hypothetical protein AVEN_150969-1 [Araneus ventricosus]|uniref:Uncharacterized protein n=1 Tax=Araneus ventricosus TaxID=182803 RepID=A0A4Y2X3A4_ARAVE|nr:hypothetical protein AVEN_1269-1 [Araneus ventricosus]GBO44000.1 hypothetical protein AVEN_145265-1 [Araneus ventricosus]GBO44002.1 hypothetical protein AVEN_148155-1 [Araneus ventricosus]GBO44004.1 hypothetical protein AVEN_150969-1 [Araneus ventricosus]